MGIHSSRVPQIPYAAHLQRFRPGRAHERTRRARDAPPFGPDGASAEQADPERGNPMPSGAPPPEAAEANGVP